MIQKEKEIFTVI